MLALGKVDEQELYDALDWLLAQQERIETTLARRHLSHGTLVLYDVSSTYFEGRTCELAKFGHNRDGKSGKLQIVFGLLCTKDGCPVAIEVFDGNVADPATLANQVQKLKERFALERVARCGSAWCANICARAPCTTARDFTSYMNACAPCRMALRS